MTWSSPRTRGCRRHSRTQVPAAGLATLDATYAAESGPATINTSRTSFQDWERFPVRFASSATAPLRRTEYVSALPGVGWIGTAVARPEREQRHGAVPDDQLPAGTARRRPLPGGPGRTRGGPRHRTEPVLPGLPPRRPTVPGPAAAHGRRRARGTHRGQRHRRGQNPEPAVRGRHADRAERQSARLDHRPGRRRTAEAGAGQHRVGRVEHHGEPGAHRPGRGPRRRPATRSPPGVPAPTRPPRARSSRCCSPSTTPAWTPPMRSRPACRRN